MTRTVQIDVYYEKPDPYLGFELDVPEELFADGKTDELDEFIRDNAPIGEVYVEDWYFRW